MKYIPKFILEHWIYKHGVEGPFTLYVRDGKLFGYNFSKIEEGADVYEYDLKNEKWVKTTNNIGGGP